MAAKRDKRARQARRQEKALPSYAGRRYTVLGIFVLAGAALIWRAVDQQILEKDFLQSEGADRYIARVDVPAHRGLITDRRGDVLALSTPVDSIAANPRVLGSDTRQLVVLAKALRIDPEGLRARLARYSQRHFVYLKRRMPPAEAAHVLQVAKANDINGVHVEREYKRYYPAGEVFAHVLGFTDVDDFGQEGLELAFDPDLRGEPGAKRVMRDGRRQVVDDIENIKSPRAGNHLALSIDQRLQFIAYRELKTAVKRNRAKSGSAVLLDAQTGEILALVNQPSFNPNGDRSNRAGRLRNRALTDVFEPGSTMKPFTVAAALDKGTIHADSMIDTAPGYYYLGRSQVKDSKNLGMIDVATVLRRSSNVGASRIALGLEKRDLWRVMQQLGFGSQVGTGFPGEVAGQLSDYQRWAQIDQATLSFGYGISVTTLQLAQAYGALANDGVLMPATLLKRDAPVKGRRVFNAQNTRHIRRMLESVVGDEGTAPQAAVPGYRVAGKTGTVKKFGPNGYSDARYLSLFAGMAPAEKPRFVMAVMINEPQAGKYYGGSVAGPVFSAVMAEALRLLNVTPDVAIDPALRVAHSGENR
ncbi:peptidoglycan D,D-transpeptidase FtsI family protein [Thiosocius teredinicola]|uniref:peptidoglycan D,D-transpeptidase FtsI family protein n=1 Tax=Thiosocius teredinicola TaxID=1973002 RepID=UPI000990D774